ncbi:MAG: ABC transporter ATP-binding protein [Calditrichaeota bacterium]|nr:MAG: ABC transporter ATP-binding protein [Calditrichota bacterium]
MITPRPTFLEIRHLSKYYREKTGWLSSNRKTIDAVRDVSLTIYRGECLALVGESGSGKTTLGRCLVGLIKPDEGELIYQGKNLLQLKESEIHPFRQKFQMIFQHPEQALNPRQTIRSALEEPLKVVKKLKGLPLKNRVEELLSQVGLSREVLDRFPAELSGGQKQRVAIARALSVEPELLVADEPTSSLDATYRFQILNLLKELQKRFHLTIFFISHDLAMVSAIADRIAVMYGGKVVEVVEESGFSTRVKHPYTKILLNAALPEEQSWIETDRASLIKGENISREGCGFRYRCPYVIEKCHTEPVGLKELSPGHQVACHQIEANPLVLEDVERFSEKWGEEK